MNIKEVEKRLNITRANIRYYEKEGLLEPKRNENEYRDYSEDDLKRLQQILLFRKCNVSIQDIRLILNGSKTIDEVFKTQVVLIEKEIKELEGAKLMCEKLAHEKASIDTMNTEKYIDMMNTEEENGHKFYDISEDFILAKEKLYQSIVENNEFIKGEKMKKGLKVLLYVGSAVLLFLCLILCDYLFDKNIDWSSAIIFTTLFTVADTVGVRKYLENKNGKKFTKKQNIKHYVITILVMIIALFGYYSFEYLYTVNYAINGNVLEMSVKKALSDIASEKYADTVSLENHKILDYEVKNDELYVYVVASYKENEDVPKSIAFTLVYSKNKNDSGIYELKEFKEGENPTELKEKINVDFEEPIIENK